jgi:hypothetical protein
VQISNWSYIKHAFLSLNSASTCGGTCVPSSQGGARMGLHCSDVYSQGNNSDRYYLGPPEELDPWLGVWNPVGSYFDRGDPDVGLPANHDGNRSLSQTQTSAFDSVKNRVIVQERELTVANSTYWYGIELVHQGESELNRVDNLASRNFTPSWNGSSWSLTTGSAAFMNGTILQRWVGSTLNSGRNGNDDGTFYVAVKVTNPQPGTWHYEYAVHNTSNSRGGAAFRLPVCQSATVRNAGFRDIDSDPLNDWTVSRQGNELAWLAPAGNPQNWNTIYNFWFDCDAAPVSGQVQIDEARLGAGNLSVAVASQVPGVTTNVTLGPGCGNPAPAIVANSSATIPNPGFGLNLQGDANAAMIVFTSFGTANLPIGACTQYLDGNSLNTHGLLIADGAGAATILLPVPNDPGLQGLALSWQFAEIQAGGPLFGTFALSNGLEVRIGNGLACQ